MHNSLWFQGVDDLSQRPELENLLRESPLSLSITPPNDYALTRGISPVICVRQRGNGYLIMPLGVNESATYCWGKRELSKNSHLVKFREKFFILCPRYLKWEESDDSLAQTFFNNPHFTK